MSLQTPVKIRMLQRKLYRKAKEEPSYRFYLLYDKISREDILAHAYALVKANGGAPGVDGQTFLGIETAGQEEWLAGIRNELREKRYEPQAVRRVLIPKPNGGERALGIPTIRDRVVQTAAKLLLEPIFEADLEPNAYGYRPRRSAQGAVEEVERLLRAGYTEVVDADLSKYFDTIPHRELLQCVARRIVDRDMLRLIKLWLKTPVEERDENGNRRRIGGWHGSCGTPQGGVISPLLANLYMNRFLKHWRQSGRSEAYRAHVINYADDFVILSRGHAVEALEWTRRVMAKLGLTINEAKTSLRNAWREEFDFLGYTFGRLRHFQGGYWYFGARPSQKSIGRLRGKVGVLLTRRNLQPWPEVRDQLNRILRGWRTYFCCGMCIKAVRVIDNYVPERVRRFLVQRHKIQGGGTRRFPDSEIFGALGVIRLRHLDRASSLWACDEAYRKAGCGKSARPV
jgi:RNA-directed DNA polymerase